MKFPQVKILATGMSVPKRYVKNEELTQWLDTTDEWIRERSGIEGRYISDKTIDPLNVEQAEYPSDLGTRAAQMALKNANLTSDDIDCIIVATASRDMPLPSTAALIQQKLLCSRTIPVMDLSAACSGFVYALETANALLKIGQYKRILLIGTEMLSSLVDWQDRSTCILLGDGAGALILEASDEQIESDIFATLLKTDSKGMPWFNQPVGGSATPITSHHLENKEQFVRMQGREMFKMATRTLAQNSIDVCKKANIPLEAVDWVVPHQANLRIIETTAQILGLSMEKVIVNINQMANTSAASIPIAFHQAIEQGKIQRGQTVLFTAFGAGVTSGACVFKY